MIKEEEASRPSVRLSSGKEVPKIAGARSTEPARLAKLVRGGMGWMVMELVGTEWVRRDDSERRLAHDIERYLADEPVEACPPSASYRVKKFVRRNKGPVLAAISLLLVLIAGIVGTSWGLVRAEIARLNEEEQKIHAQS